MRQAYDRPTTWLRTIYTRTSSSKFWYAKVCIGIFWNAESSNKRETNILAVLLYQQSWHGASYKQAMQRDDKTRFTTRKPLLHDPYNSHESFGSWACINTSSYTNDMQFINCTIRKPFFHDPYDSPTCIYTPSLSNVMQFTNCTTRKPLFHEPYNPYETYGSRTCIRNLSL